jgi:hypothetical protein
VLDPVVTTATVTCLHGLMIWDQLCGLDSELRPQPQMVEGHTVKDDGKCWTFRLPMDCTSTMANQCADGIASHQSNVAANVTKRLWQVNDIVEVLEAWEKSCGN